MPFWLKIAESPFMRFALVILVLGLLRLVLLTILDVRQALRQAGNPHLPFQKIAGETLGWLFPVKHLRRSSNLYSWASVGFHIGIMIPGLFLANHINILYSNTGLRWFNLAKPVLDMLTLVGIFAVGYLLLFRLYTRNARALSNTMDYLFLALFLLLFCSGFVAGRPWNPLPYDGLMLIHTLLGIAIILMIPFSKIAHCVLFPLIRLSSEIAWNLVPQGGEKVIRSLHGEEGRKV